MVGAIMPGTVATVFVIPSNNLIPIIKRMTYLGREGTSYGWRNHARDCGHSVCDTQQQTTATSFQSSNV
ncbi:hypothetical protein RRG08_005029 [Elysia crispata]|uniref:Uncharacterized protein n=1 Tax=Elysia crispata TaxID=231223 RepID=A0AAE1B301_9GAST|nr:hypothetical protein RRG08_005029 [Elysia crispata]